MNKNALLAAVARLDSFQDPRLKAILVRLSSSLGGAELAPFLMKALFSFTELLGRQNGELSETDIELLLALLAHVEGQPGPDFLEQCLSVARLSRDRRVVEAARAAASAVVETMR